MEEEIILESGFLLRSLQGLLAYKKKLQELQSGENL